MHLRRSKLEVYEAILKALVKKPLKIDSIAYKVSLDCVILKKSLDFLVENGLVEERLSERGTRYAATERGISVFKTLDFQKYLKRIQKTLLTMDDAMKVLPELSRANDKPGRESLPEKY